MSDSKAERIYTVQFDNRETLPDAVEKLAASLDITPSELIKRFIIQGMKPYIGDAAPSVPGESLEDFLVKNGALKPRSH